MFTDSFIIVVDFLHIVPVHIHVDHLLDVVIAHQVINLSATLAQEMAVRAGIGIITCVTLVDSQGLCGACSLSSFKVLYTVVLDSVGMEGDSAV